MSRPPPEEIRFDEIWAALPAVMAPDRHRLGSRLRRLTEACQRGESIGANGSAW